MDRLRDSNHTDRKAGPFAGGVRLSNRAKRLAYDVVASLILPYAVRKLKSELRVQRSVPEWVDFAFRFHRELIVSGRDKLSFTIAPWQRKLEFTALLQASRDLNLRRVLEVGTAAGGTLFLFARIAHPRAVLASVDLPFSSGGYPAWREKLYREFAWPGQQIILIRADSHSDTCRRRVKSLAGAEGFDLLFIDGDHSYEGVLRDFKLYAPLVRTGGLIALHDIVPGGNSRGVPRAWSELKKHHSAFEIVEEPQQEGFGIGVIENDRQIATHSTSLEQPLAPQAKAS